MRPIKFRAWDKIGKVMIDWFAIRQTAFNRGGYTLLYEILMNHSDNFVVMQFTGLLDKNGKEIYEGDIMDYGGNDGKKEVVFSGGSFGVVTRSENGASFGSYQINDGVVIGNVYENLELTQNKQT